MTVGDMFVDLSDPEIMRDGDLSVDVSLGVGSTTLVVPEGLPVVIHASIGTGAIESDDLDPDWSISWTGGGASIESSRRALGQYWKPYWDDTAAGGINIALTAQSAAATEGGKPPLTIEYAGSIGLLRIIESD
jgi:hypothetical protein